MKFSYVMPSWIFGLFNMKLRRQVCHFYSTDAALFCDSYLLMTYNKQILKVFSITAIVNIMMMRMAMVNNKNIKCKYYTKFEKVNLKIKSLTEAPDNVLLDGGESMF